MRRAGAAASKLALALLAGANGPVLVLAGPGNNGGDALECAANLAAAGIEVDIVHLAGATPSPEARQAPERAHAALGAAARIVEAIGPARGHRVAGQGPVGHRLRAGAGRRCLPPTWRRAGAIRTRACSATS